MIERSKRLNRFCGDGRVSAAAAMVAASLLAGGAATAARGATVWSDDFSGDTAGSAPQRNYVIATGNDWNVGAATGITSVVSGSVGSPAPSFSITDTSTTAGTSSFVNMNRFATFNTTNPDQGRLTVSFDFRVDSFLSPSAVSTFRFTVQNGNTTSATVNAMTVGLGYANVDGVAGNELFLMAAAQSAPGSSSSGVATVTPSATTAIGFSNNAFDPNLNFGEYDGTTSANNNTKDEFYRFTLTFTDGSGDVAGTVTRLSNGATINFTRSLPTGNAFSFTGGTGSKDAIQVWVPQSGTGQLYIDNVNASVQAVPEPATAGAALLTGAGLLLGRRRKR